MLSQVVLACWRGLVARIKGSAAGTAHALRAALPDSAPVSPYWLRHMLTIFIGVDLESLPPNAGTLCSKEITRPKMASPQP